ncbi:hypothetical protein K4U71_06490 [Staphylococcus epidermidis]|uniref:DM13 domain-containing protein n=1 Tax=Bacillus cereus TaxID=1396 RepID=UPI003601655C|nr:hypothetical protein [Staphylococcus epidermidis]
MNTKYLLAVGAIVTSLTLGACGNSNSESDHANHKDKQQEESNVKTDTTKKLSGNFESKNGDIKSGKKISTVDYNKSKQTFDLKNVDLEKYNEVTIYCEKAHVIFGGAKLK